MHRAALTAAASSLARAEIVSLPLYSKSIDLQTLHTEYGSTDIAKLDANESPLGPSPTVHSEYLDFALSDYPDADCVELKRRISERTGVDSDCLVVGNGSESLIHLICQAFLQPGERVVLPAPNFSLFETYSRAMRAKVDKVAMHPQSFVYDIEAWREAVREPCKLIAIVNPSNPVGCMINSDDFASIIEAIPEDVLLLIDEAYYEYALADGLPDALSILTKMGRHFFILRTFSKAYGLAGLRIGYGIASSNALIDSIDRLRTPYNVNALAQAKAIAAFSDQKYLSDVVNFTVSQREKLAADLRREGFFVAPSSANFLFVKCVVPAQILATKMLKHGVLVKAWNEPGYENFLRVSIGLPEMNARFLKAILCEHSLVSG